MLEDFSDHCHKHSELKPVFFRLSIEQDRKRIEELLRSDPRIEIYDTYRTQVEELIETRNPSRTFKKDDLAREVDRVFAGKNPEELGVWVHYPWSHRLVHILEEDEFIELRTDRNHYQITPAEQGLLSRKKVGVVGLSVGQSVSVTMAMERVLGELRIADFDRLGLSNLNRFRAGVHQLDIPKVAVTAREIAEIDP